MLYNVGSYSVVGVTTSYGLEGPGIEPGGREFSPPVQAGTGDHLAFCTMRPGLLSGIKRPGHGAGNPPYLAWRLKKVGLFFFSSLGHRVKLTFMCCVINYFYLIRASCQKFNNRFPVIFTYFFKTKG
jgi:hypothetical protein